MTRSEPGRIKLVSSAGEEEYSVTLEKFFCCHSMESRKSDRSLDSYDE
jgi:hypothetical protein